MNYFKGIEGGTDMFSVMIIILTIIPLTILLIGFFEVRLPFIKTPPDVIFSHQPKVEEKKIKKFVRRRALLNKYHIGFINLTPDYTYD